MFTIMYKFSGRSREVDVSSPVEVQNWLGQALLTPHLYSNVHIMVNVDDQFTIPDEIK